NAPEWFRACSLRVKGVILPGRRPGRNLISWRTARRRCFGQLPSSASGEVNQALPPRVPELEPQAAVDGQWVEGGPPRRLQLLQVGHRTSRANGRVARTSSRGVRIGGSREGGGGFGGRRPATGGQVIAPPAQGLQILGRRPNGGRRGRPG